MTEHCGFCGSRLCGHGTCPECSRCDHCDGGDRNDKFFGYEEDESTEDKRAEYYSERNRR